MQEIIQRTVWVGCALARWVAPVGAQDATGIKPAFVPQVSQESVKKLAHEEIVLPSSTTFVGPMTVHRRGGRVH
jgi:hypothetical protein